MKKNKPSQRNAASTKVKQGFPDKPIPHDPGAEAAVLGSMIVDPACIGGVAKALERDAFYLPANQTIWDAILARQNRADGIDGLLVRAELEQRGKLEAIGGSEYLQKVLETVPSSANVHYYVGLMRDQYIRRRTIELAQRLLDGAYSETVNISERLQETREDLEGIGEPTGVKGLVTFCADDIKAEEPTWHLLNIIPDFGLTIIQGDGGVGKSRLSHSLAAKTSTGEPLSGTNLRPRKGSVRIYSLEDPAPFIVRNLRAEGADCRAIHIVPELCTLPGAIAELGEWVVTHPACRLVIFDSLPSYLGTADGNSNVEVRVALTPLAKFAAERHIAVIGVNHLNKKRDLPHVHRGLGSTAFTALARAVWGVILDQDDPELRLFGPVKTNYSINPQGLQYRIIDGAVVFERDPWTGHLDDSLKPRDGKLKVDRCATWLRDRLQAGSVLSATIFEESVEQGFNRDLCYRAKEQIGLHVSKAGFGGQWYWELKHNGDLVT